MWWGKCLGDRRDTVCSDPSLVRHAQRQKNMGLLRQQVTRTAYHVEAGFVKAVNERHGTRMSSMSETDEFLCSREADRLSAVEDRQPALSYLVK